MKTGMTLTQLAIELDRIKTTKKDFLADTRSMSMQDDGKTLMIGEHAAKITDHSRTQLATRLKVPMDHYKRLEANHPDLLAHMVTGLMKREPQKTLVRTLDGNVRGILSNSFRPLDCADMAEQAILPELLKRGATIESCQLTPTKMYIKALCPWLDRELPVPAGLKMGVGHTFFPRRIIGALTVSNSDVGDGGVVVNPGAMEKQCTNLATFKDASFARRHIGRKNHVEDEGINEFLSDQTRRLEDAAVWAKVRDIVVASMDGRIIDSVIAKMLAAREDAIEGDPIKVVEVFAEKYNMAESEKGGLLKHLANAGEMTRYGLQWAVTRLSQDVESYDRASELERLGGQVIELAPHDWKVISQAA